MLNYHRRSMNEYHSHVCIHECKKKDELMDIGYCNYCDLSYTSKQPIFMSYQLSSHFSPRMQQCCLCMCKQVSGGGGGRGVLRRNPIVLSRAKVKFCIPISAYFPSRCGLRNLPKQKNLPRNEVYPPEQWRRTNMVLQ